MDFSTIKGVTLPGNLEVKKMQHGNDVLWESGGGEEDYSTMPFFVQNLTNSSIDWSFTAPSYLSGNKTLYYSTDGTNWETWGNVSSNTKLTLTIPAKERRYIKTDMTTFMASNWPPAMSNPLYYYSSITSTGNFEIGGQLIKLFPDNTALSVKCFRELFKGCTQLKYANKLYFPSNEPVEECYRGMFTGSGLITPPLVLPSTKPTGSYAYAYMFSSCTSMTSAPALPATSLYQNCYYGMFKSCTSLTTAPSLPATTLAKSCYGYMFNGCTSLTTAPTLPASTLQTYCYEYMFKGCTKLTTAPVLKALTLKNYCYRQMFYGCSILNYIKAMFTTLATSSLDNWVNGVAATGTFVKNSSATWTNSGVSGVPTGWTVQTAAS